MEPAAEVTLPRQTYIVGKSGDGKTALTAALLLGCGLYTQDEYAKGHPVGKNPPRITALESYQKLKSMSPSGKPEKYTVLRTPDCYFDPESTTCKTWRQQAQMDLDRATHYRLEKTFQYRRLLFGLPLVGGTGTVGSVMSLTVSPATEPQLLFVFKTEGQLQDLLIQFLGLLGKDNKNDMQNMQYLNALWHAVVPPGIMPQAEAVKFEADTAFYKAPLKPLIQRLLGRSYIARGRRRDRTQAPDLHMEMGFLSDLLELLNPREVDGDAGHKELLEELAQQDPSGPWSEVLSSPSQLDALQALLVCLQSMQVFVPNHLLLALDNEIVDSIGATDDNPHRRVLARQQEETISSMLVMVARTLESSGVQNYLVQSPFLDRWVADPDNLKLSIMLHMERVGLVLPRSAAFDDRERGADIDANYVLKYKDHLVSQHEKIVELIQAQFKTLLAEHLKNEHPDKLPLLDSLARKVHVFYAMPQLGIMANAQLLRPGSSHLPPGVTRAQLEEVLQVSQLPALIGALALPWMEESKSAAEAEVEEFKAQIAQAKQDEKTAGRLCSRLAQMKKQSLYCCRAPMKKEAELHHTGQGSVLAVDFHKTFRALGRPNPKHSVP